MQWLLLFAWRRVRFNFALVFLCCFCFWLLFLCVLLVVLLLFLLLFGFFFLGGGGVVVVVFLDILLNFHFGVCVLTLTVGVGGTV